MTDDARRRAAALAAVTSAVLIAVKVVLAESFYHQLGLQATSVWKPTPGLIITQATESLGKGRILPVVITLAGETKK